MSKDITDELIIREDTSGYSFEKSKGDREEDIKILEDFIYEIKSFGLTKDTLEVSYAIENLIKAYKEKDKDNNDLRRLYRRTAVKLRENGKEELADYFLAQINEVPTFVVDDDIDYYTEYYKLKEENEDLKNLANKKQWISPCYVAQNFIPVSLVEEKIEEYQNNMKLYENETHNIFNENNIRQEVITVLQELLEKR